MDRIARFALLSVVLALLLSIAPSTLAAQSSALTVIRLGSSADDQISPVLYAMRTGMFERAGLKIEMTKMNSGAAVAAAVASGALDFGKSSILGLVIGHSKGVPFTIVAPAGLWASKPEGGLIVRSDSTIHTAKDFAGKTVSAAAVVDINTLAMQAWLDQNGADPKAVKFVELPTLEAPVALAAGRVDGATLFNPAYAKAMADGKSRLVAPIFNAIAKRFLLGTWFTTTDYVQKNRGIVERFSRVVAEASAYAGAHPDDTLDDIVAFTGIDKSLIVHMQRSTQTPVANAADLQPVIDVAVKYGVIDKSFPATELISDAALKTYTR
jgi:NitT/TauT family transport system substrate-binding protein